MLWPVRSEAFGSGGTRDHGIIGVYIEFGGPIGYFTQGSQCQYEVQATNEPWVMGDGTLCIEVIQRLFEHFAEEDRSVHVETGKVDVYDLLDHSTIFGKPYIYGGWIGAAGHYWKAR